jgi:hypothetical protein
VFWPVQCESEGSGGVRRISYLLGDYIADS